MGKYSKAIKVSETRTLTLCHRNDFYLKVMISLKILSYIYVLVTGPTV